ncbi:uncharacterized protein [Dermacentor andersoni]|nr:uncharacterized protein LOC129383774 isoform X2 [Dermacentor andersoni]
MSRTAEDTFPGNFMQLSVVFSLINTSLYLFIVAYLMLQTGDLRSLQVYNYGHLHATPNASRSDGNFGHQSSTTAMPHMSATFTSSVVVRLPEPPGSGRRSLRRRS